VPVPSPDQGGATLIFDMKQCIVKQRPTNRQFCHLFIADVHRFTSSAHQRYLFVFWV